MCSWRGFLDSWVFYFFFHSLVQSWPWSGFFSDHSSLAPNPEGTGPNNYGLKPQQLQARINVFPCSWLSWMFVTVTGIWLTECSDAKCSLELKLSYVGICWVHALGSDHPHQRRHLTPPQKLCPPLSQAAPSTLRLTTAQISVTMSWFCLFLASSPPSLLKM